MTDVELAHPLTAERMMPPVFAFIWFAVAALSLFQLIREWRQQRLNTSRTIQYLLLAVGAGAAGYLLIR